jgi:HlyD family secretion protein
MEDIMKKNILTLLSIVLVLSGCNLTFKKDKEEQVKPSIPVETTTVENTEITNTLVYAGQIKPSTSVMVASKVAGKVLSTFFELGDKVNEGAIMLTLDEQSVRDQIKTLESQVAIASQAVTSAQNGVEAVTGGKFESQNDQLQNAVTSATKQVEIAEIARNNASLALSNANDSLTTAKTNFDTTKILYESGSSSKNDFDRMEQTLKQAESAFTQSENAIEQAEISYEQAVNALDSANASLSLNKGTLVTENLKSANLGVAQALANKNSSQIQLDIANKSLNDTSVKAPISGLVSFKNVTSGEFTSTQNPAYTIIDINTVHVDVNISEVLINTVAIGQDVDIYINSVRSEPFVGKILNISPTADQTSTFPVVLSLENLDNVLKPGMFAQVHFVKESSKNAISVPRNTVLDDGTGQYIYIYDNSRARRVDVTTGIDTGVDIQILSGLKSGDKVITKGQTYVTNGDSLHETNGGN